MASQSFATDDSLSQQREETELLDKVKKFVDGKFGITCYKLFSEDQKVALKLGEIINLRRGSCNERSLENSRSQSEVVPSPKKRPKLEEAANGDRHSAREAQNSDSLDEQESTLLSSDHNVDTDTEEDNIVDDGELDYDDNDDDDEIAFEPSQPEREDFVVIDDGESKQTNTPNSVEQRMVKTWTSLLDEKVVPDPSATRRSDRIKKRGGREPIVDSQSQSQSTVVSMDVAEFHPKQKEGNARTCGFKVDTTMRSALQILLKSRGEIQITEERHTQYVVNRIVRAVLPELQTWFKDHSICDWGTEYQKYLELDLYEETSNQHKSNLRTHPDSLLYVKGAEAPTELDNEALSRGCLVSFEHKVNLLEQKLARKALSELERDYAEKMCANDIYEQAVGYGVMTDGILWRFYQFRTVIDSMGHPTLATRMSEDVYICEKGDKEIIFNFDRLAMELLNTFRQSLSTRRLPAQESEETIVIGDQCYTINQYLDIGDRRIVVKAFPGRGSKDAGVIIKFPIVFFAVERKVSRGNAEAIGRVKREQQSIENELNNLKTLGGESNIVGFAPGFESFSDFVVMEDVGVSLNSIICGGKAGKVLACVVYKDIWCLALESLKKLGLCHADIHVGNICLRLLDDGKFLKATLVDLESALSHGGKLRNTPIKIRRKNRKLYFENAQEAWDRSCVCSILECLWEETLSLENVGEKTGYWVENWKRTEEPHIISTISKNKAQYLPNSAFDKD